jgi:diacylglycerol kinase (ATP)
MRTAEKGRKTASGRPLVIANPAARSGRTEGELPALLKQLAEAVGPVELAATTHRGHGQDLAARAVAEGREVVICVGGDGALNEVVNGLLTGRRGDRPSPLPAAELPRLGILATGTGGDFGRSLGITAARNAYLEALARGRERLVDVALARFAPRRRDEDRVLRRLSTVPHRIRSSRERAERSPFGAEATVQPSDAPQRSSLMESRYFLNVLSAGIGGLVDRYAAALPAAVGGRLSYGLAAVTAVVTCRRRRLTLTVTMPDRSTTTRFFDGYAIAVANGHTFGGGMNIAPHAKPDDGLLEIVTFETRDKLIMLRHFLSLYAGEHLTKPGVHHFACLRLELADAGREAPHPGDLFPLDVDGDNLGDLPLAVEVVPRALRVLA